MMIISIYSTHALQNHSQEHIIAVSQTKMDRMGGHINCGEILKLIVLRQLGVIPKLL